jgi:hypothetical protein
LFVFEPAAGFDVGVELEFIGDGVLFADFVVVADDFFAWGVEGRPIWVLGE